MGLKDIADLWQKKRAEHRLELGRERRGQGDLEGALRILEQSRGRMERARTWHCKSATEKELHEISRQLARNLREAGQLEQAIGLLIRRIESTDYSGTHMDTHVLLADMVLSTGDEVHFEKVVAGLLLPPLHMKGQVARSMLGCRLRLRELPTLVRRILSFPLPIADQEQAARILEGYADLASWLDADHKAEARNRYEAACQRLKAAATNTQIMSLDQLCAAVFRSEKEFEQNGAESLAESVSGADWASPLPLRLLRTLSSRTDYSSLLEGLLQANIVYNKGDKDRALGAVCRLADDYGRPETALVALLHVVESPSFATLMDVVCSHTDESLRATQMGTSPQERARACAKEKDLGKMLTQLLAEPPVGDQGMLTGFSRF